MFDRLTVERQLLHERCDRDAEGRNGNVRKGTALSSAGLYAPSGKGLPAPGRVVVWLRMCIVPQSRNGADLFLEQLLVVQRGVQAVLLQELFVRPLLGDSPLVEHENAVAVFHR